MHDPNPGDDRKTPVGHTPQLYSSTGREETWHLDTPAHPTTAAIEPGHPRGSVIDITATIPGADD